MICHETPLLQALVQFILLQNFHYLWQMLHMYLFIAVVDQNVVELNYGKLLNDLKDIHCALDSLNDIISHSCNPSPVSKKSSAYLWFLFEFDDGHFASQPPK